MADRLNQLGIENSLTRNSDITLDATQRPRRVQSFYGNGSDVIVVSNHINAGGGDGAEVIYALRNNDTLSRGIANELSRAGQNVRKYYQRRLSSDPSKDYYYMLRNTPNNETIIVEYGFLDSKGDDVNQLKNNYRTLTEAVVKALASYIGVPYQLPGEQVGNYYVVQKGDTLYSIARNYGVTVNQIMSANNLTNSSLSVGQSLIIPEIGDENAEILYTVKSGDTLYKIANMFNMTVNELKVLNNLSSNTLSIGQQLKVNQSNSEEIPIGNTYTVVSGDSLYSISKKFNVSVDELKNANNKTNNLLSIGEILIIPNETVITPRTHIVKSGDTLWNIARLYNTTVDAIKELNNLVSNTLSIGMILNLPE